MATHELLSIAARTQLSSFPPLEARDLIRYYTLSERDLSLIVRRRGDENRLGFAVQLCHLRFPGWTWQSDDDIPQTVVAFIAKQLKINSASLDSYAQTRDTTRREHLREIAEAYGFRSFGETEQTELSNALMPIALATDSGLRLVSEMLDAMREHKVIIPALSSVERFAWELRQQARDRVENQLISGLGEDEKRRLDLLLTSETESKTVPLTWLRQPPSVPSPRNFLRLAEKLQYVRALGFDLGVGRGVHQNRLRQLAREGAKMMPHNLRRIASGHRYAVLVAFLSNLAGTLTDQLVEMHDHLLGTLLNKSERDRDEAFLAQGKAINEKVGLYAQLGKALIQARTDQDDPYTVIDTVLGWDSFVETVTEAEKLARPADFDALEFALTRYSWFRQYTPTLLATLEFHGAPAVAPLLQALTLLRKMNVEGSRTVPRDAPLSFVKPRWRRYVIQSGGIDRRYYELCALDELRGRLRAGDVWVVGSKQYQDFGDYLLPLERWRQRTNAKDVPVAVETDFDTYLEARSGTLHEALSKVDGLLARGELPDVKLAGNTLRMSPLKKAVPEGVEMLRRRVYARLPRIKLTDLLVEVDSWTRFSAQFTHAQTDEPTQNQKLLLSAILADGVNLGLEKMAQVSPGMSYEQLVWTSDWHLRDETYQRALVQIVNAHHRLPFAKRWGDGTTSSSDGQFFPAGGQKELAARVNARYGQQPGLTYYTHISDQYAPFYTKVIATTTRDATYVLDGLLYHETDLEIAEHYSDTHGYTDQVFGMCHLLGFRFAPRIRDLGDKRLFTMNNLSAYPTLAPLLGGTINVKQIRTHWDDVLRLASSIKTGTVTASLILRKLAAYPRQNGLAWALRELGRIEKTLFALEWYQDPELRQRVTVGLNKGELRNSLARAVHFHRLGEVRDRSLEAQLHKASGLNLIIAAIALWNTAYLSAIVDDFRDEGQEITDEQLGYLSPLGWGHINLTGNYTWDLGRKTRLEHLQVALS